MPVERFYLLQNYEKGSTLALEDTERHHLVNVLRMQVGDVVELVNGQGALSTAKLVEINKKNTLLQILETTQSPKPACEIVLAQALPKLNRLEFLVEKGTELGMTQLWLFPGARSEKKELTLQQQQRLNLLSIAAMKQCGRLFLPEIIVKPALAKWKEIPFKAFFGDLDPDAPPLLSCLAGQSENLIIFIGPESGFAKEEQEILKNKLHAQGVKLHANILRTDTAGLAALALMTHLSLNDSDG